MAHNSPYTGTEIDNAIAAVRQGVYVHYIVFTASTVSPTQENCKGSLVLINNDSTLIDSFQAMYANLGNGDDSLYYPCSGEAFQDTDGTTTPIYKNDINVIISIYTTSAGNIHLQRSGRSFINITANNNTNGNYTFTEIKDTMTKVL